MSLTMSSYLWLMLAGGAQAANWAVIVAGSKGYSNYRHQADACHAYNTLRRKGIAADHIIQMSYDDVAHDPQNPFQGQLFNRPDPDGLGEDVYADCQIDYRGSQVTSANFLKVLTGEGPGKVLNSTSDDHVFVYWTDHGAPGLIAFPEDDDVLHKANLTMALQQMHSARMFKRLVFYLEACESGSMFEGLDIPGVYALTAANATQSSYATYCGDEAKVDGKSLGTCLADAFSAAWLEDSDGRDVSAETLEQQYKIVQNRANGSQVLQFGDLSFQNDTVAEYIGSKPAALGLGAFTLKSFTGRDGFAASSAVSVRSQHVHSLFSRYATAKSSSERLSEGAKLQAELSAQANAEAAFRRFVELAYPDDKARQEQARLREEKPDHPECELAGHAAISQHCAGQFRANSGFALQFQKVIVNVCADIARGMQADVVALAKSACTSRSDVFV